MHADSANPAPFHETEQCRRPGPADPEVGRPDPARLLIRRFVRESAQATREPPRRPAARLSQSHGLTCLAVAGGRLLHPGDAHAEPLEAIRIRALLLLHASGYPSGPDRSSGLGHPRERLAESNRRHRELPATPLPRIQSSRPRSAFTIQFVALL